MYCKNCGAEINEGALFCGNCGVKLEIEQPVAEETVCEEYDQEVNTECQQECCVTPVIPEKPVSAAVPAEKPNTVFWIVLSAIHIFVCFPLTGIISLIFSILGHLAADKGDFADAFKKLKFAKISFWIGFGIGLLAILVCLLVFVLGFATGLAEELLYY